MTGSMLVPAAQYLRMSTEHQQYSNENQAQCILQYAQALGFEVVVTYSDPAKSGLLLRNRAGLRQLIQDVTAGKTSYKVILVYDVSRWGRFQDVDESAHYEFLCKSAGIPVHYCAETFANDGSMPSSMMKALKRIMAGEYSRELGNKVLDGQKNLARLGFKQGGAPGYGLRRMLVSADRQPKLILTAGMRKSITTDRVILVPGPAHEIGVVRMIYRLFTKERRSVNAITKELNRRRIPFLDHEKWYPWGVMKVLSHPKYMGAHAFNQTTMRLGAPKVNNPRREWIVTRGAYESIIDETTFMEAQKILQNLTIRKSDEQVLEDLRALLVSEGRLSTGIIDRSLDVPSVNTICRRFGSLLRAYELISYDVRKELATLSARRRIHALRNDLLSKLGEMFPDEVRIFQPSRRCRAHLIVEGRFQVSLLIPRYVWQEKKWLANIVANERRLITLVARLDEQNREFLDFHVLKQMPSARNLYVRAGSNFFREGVRLLDLSHFCRITRELYAQRKQERAAQSCCETAHYRNTC